MFSRPTLEATAKVGKVVTIQLVDDTTEIMVISQFGKIIRIDTKSVRAAGRSTSGVRLLNLESDDRVASATATARHPTRTPKNQRRKRHLSAVIATMHQEGAA